MATNKCEKMIRDLAARYKLIDLRDEGMPKLWQTVDVDDLAADVILTNTQWIEFVKYAQGTFAEEASGMAAVLFDNWRFDRGI